MVIEKKVRLNNSVYYVLVDVEYRVDDRSFTRLCMKDLDECYDGGNFSLLIEKIEMDYSDEKSKLYDSEIKLMGDVLYLYDRIPFLNGVKEVYIADNDNLPYSTSYISKSEIDKYIEEHCIQMKDQSNFKLGDERTWLI